MVQGSNDKIFFCISNGLLDFLRIYFLLLVYLQPKVWPYFLDLVWKMLKKWVFDLISMGSNGSKWAQIDTHWSNWYWGQMPPKVCKDFSTWWICLNRVKMYQNAMKTKFRFGQYNTNHMAKINQKKYNYNFFAIQILYVKSIYWAHILTHLVL